MPPCYHREFAQATCAIFSYAEAGFWQGAGKSLAHPGKRHRAGAHARKSRFCREKFATIWRAMKKNVTKRPNGLTPAERKAWDDIVREMESRGIDPKGRV